MDDSILTGPDLQELDKIIKNMKRVGLDLTVRGRHIRLPWSEYPMPPG